MLAKHTRRGRDPVVSTQAGARLRSVPPGQPFVADNWRLMAPFMVLVGLIASASTRSLPGAASLALVFPGIVLCWTAPLVNRRERERLSSAMRRRVLQGLHVSLPMLLFGLAIASWTGNPATMNWPDTIGAPIILSLLAALILNRRIASILNATLSLWLGVALLAGTAGTALMIVGGLVLGLRAAVWQADSDRRAVATERERRRNQLRAEQLLTEFEESGQGWFFDTDRRGALVYVSPTVGKVLGRRAQDLLGRPFSELFQPDAEEGEDAQYSSRYSTNGPRFEISCNLRLTKPFFCCCCLCSGR